MFSDGSDQFDGLRALPQNHKQFRGHIKDIQQTLARRYYLAPELVELCTRVGANHHHTDPNGSLSSQVKHEEGDVERYGYDKDFARYYAQQVHRVIAHFRKHTKCNLEVDVDLRYPAGMRLRKPNAIDTMDKGKIAKKASQTSASSGRPPVNGKYRTHVTAQAQTPSNQRYNIGSNSSFPSDGQGQKGMQQSLQSPLSSTSMTLVSSQMKHYMNGGKEIRPGRTDGNAEVGVDGSFIAQPTKSYLFSSPPSKSKSDSQPSSAHHQQALNDHNHHNQNANHGGGGGFADARTLFATPSSNDPTGAQIVKQERELRDLMDRQNQTSYVIQQQRSQMQKQHYPHTNNRHDVSSAVVVVDVDEDNNQENRTPWQHRHTDKYTGKSHVVDVDGTDDAHDDDNGDEGGEEEYDEEDEYEEGDMDETEISVAWKTTSAGAYSSGGSRNTDQHREDTQKLFSTPPEFKGFALNVDDEEDDEDDEDEDEYSN